MYALISLLIALLFAAPVSGATLNMPADCANLQACMAAMSGGDTLSIATNTYTGATNTIDGTHAPPSGTAEAWTIIKAATDWGVIFDGENARTMFYTYLVRNYVRFEGIKWVNNTDSSPLINGWSYFKFQKCAFHLGASAFRKSTVWIGSSTYGLLEDCHAWGDGRYSVNLQTSDHMVIRRFVSRLDAVNASLEDGTAPYPAGHLMSYASQFVEWQNCIALDSNQTWYRSPASYYLGGFTTHALYGGEYTANNYYRGCLALNIDMHQPNPNYSSSPGPGFQLDNVRNCYYYDCVAAAVVGRGFSGNSLTGYPSEADRCHIKITPDPNGFGDCVNSSGNFTITNSVLTNANRAGLRGGAVSDYCALYANTTNYSSGSIAGAHNITATDPYAASILHLTQVETGSALDGAGAAGVDIGPTILKKVGTDGTLYDEAGYATTTANDLWPFPHEAEICTDFAGYTGPPTGARGGCASGTTLTRYVWSFLGTPTPAGIYGEEADTTAPTVAVTTAAATYTGTVVLTATCTDDVAPVRLRFYAGGAPVGAEATSFPSTAYWVTSYDDNGTYDLTANCYDARENTGTSAAVSITIENARPTLPTPITNPAGGFPVIINSGGFPVK